MRKLTLVLVMLLRERHGVASMEVLRIRAWALAVPEEPRTHNITHFSPKAVELTALLRSDLEVRIA